MIANPIAALLVVSGIVGVVGIIIALIVPPRPEEDHDDYCACPPCTRARKYRCRK